MPKTYTITYLEGTFAEYTSDGIVTDRQLLTTHADLSAGILQSPRELAADQYAAIASYTTYTYMEGLILPGDDIMARVGYSFKGWWKIRDGNNMVLSMDGVLPATAETIGNITLYAMYEASKDPIRYSWENNFDSDGGKLGEHNADWAEIYDFYKGTTLGTASRPGYTFEGWFFTKDDSYDTSENAGRIFELIKEHYVSYADPPSLYEQLGILYAHWTVEKYNVKFEFNAPVDPKIAESLTYNPYPIGSTTHIYNQSTVFLEPTRAHYNFEGWYMAGDFSGDECTEFRADWPTFDFGADKSTVTLYAKWSPKTYVISYKEVGSEETTTFGWGSNEPPNIHTYDQNTQLIEPIRVGYTFQGWYLDKDKNGGLLNKIEGKYTIPGSHHDDDNTNVSVYADWNINTYTIKLDWDIDEIDGKADDKEDSPPDTTMEEDLPHEYGRVTHLPFPIKKGWKFRGWFYYASRLDGDGVTDKNSANIIAGDEITGPNGSEITLYAGWKWIEYTISYNHYPTTTGNKEVLPIWSESEIKYIGNKPSYHRYGELTTLPTAERVGYEFLGWYLLSADGSFFELANNKILANAELPNDTGDGDGQYVIYSKWKALEYVLEFDHRILPDEIPNAEGPNAGGVKMDIPALPSGILTFGQEIPILVNSYSGMKVRVTYETETRINPNGTTTTITVEYYDYYSFNGWFINDSDILPLSKHVIYSNYYYLDQYTDYSQYLTDGVLKIYAKWELP